MMKKLPKYCTKALGLLLCTSITATAQESTEPIEEVVVTGIRASLKRAEDIKRNSSSIVDVISAEDIGKFPDNNVAESLQRITGVAISRSEGRGRQITVRGLGPEYNAVLFNGRIMATNGQSLERGNGGGGREFNFDLIASELISGASVIKTPTASDVEGSIGATVDISTARPLALNGYKAVGSAKLTYDDLDGGAGNYNVSGLFSNTFADDTFGALVSFSYKDEDYRNDFLTTNGWALADVNGDGLGDAFQNRNVAFRHVNGNRQNYGGTFALEWQPNDLYHFVLDGFLSSYEENATTVGVHTAFQDGFAGGGPRGNTVSSNQVVSNGNVVSFTNSPGQRVDLVKEFFPRYNDTTQVGLNFEFTPTDNFKLSTDIAYSKAELDTLGSGGVFAVAGYFSPSVSYDGRTDVPSVTHSVAPQSADEYVSHFTRREEDLRSDSVLDSKLDLEWHFDEAGPLVSVQSGLAYTRRTNRFNRYETQAPCPVNPQTGGVCDYSVAITPGIVNGVVNPGDYLSDEAGNFPRSFPDYDLDTYLAYLEAQRAGDQYSPVLDPSQSGSVKEKTLSAYLQANFDGDLGDMRWGGNLGLRLVSTDQTSEGQVTTVVEFIDLPPDNSLITTVEPSNISSSYTELLPSLNFKLDITDQLTLRLAAARVLTRPTLSNLSTRLTTNPRDGARNFQGGNPDLKPFQADQYDLSLEWYPVEGTSFSAAYFKKELDSFVSIVTLPVEIASNTGGTVTFQESLPRNGENASIDGYEFAALHTMNYLPEPFDGLGVQANVTLVDSSAQFAPSVSSGSFSVEGLSDLSYNLILFYDNGSKFQGRVAYNFRSDYLLRAIEEQSEPLLFDDYGQLDVSASYDINDNITLVVEASNLTNERERRFQREVARVRDIRYSGARVTFGIKASF